MYDDYDDTDYSQLEYSDDYVSKSKQSSENDKKREKKLQEEVALLRKMLR